MRPWIVRLPFGLLLLTAVLLIAAVLATAHGLHSWSSADLPFDLLVDGDEVGAGLQQQMALSSLGGAAVLCLAALLLVGLLVAVPLVLLGLLGLMLLGLGAVLLAVLGGPLLALGLVLGLLLAPLVGLALLLRWLVR
ncbi:hypothetical protein [Pseudaquabacterium pictum]|uniref:Uncharacterized protein n=1 Tax=Pseudaquabacterium pictum TaxID=2315236 RepID=A0A480AWN4_9BURK|nr:hypothetical protein [Rubrivivax pictus]GCL65306.1 hypothetical protein AQPW35_43870 [Rubrivivax pictus]